MPTIKKPEIKFPEFNTDLTKAAKDVAAVAKDATYVVIGAGVLGFQQAQVQRQELLKRLSDPKADFEGGWHRSAATSAAPSTPSTPPSRA